MSAESHNPSRVLLFGKDMELLETRAMVLRSVGMTVDIATNLRDFNTQVGSSGLPYGVTVCCFSASDFERDEINSIANGNCVPLLNLGGSLSPQRLIEEVSSLISEGRSQSRYSEE